MQKVLAILSWAREHFDALVVTVYVMAATLLPLSVGSTTSCTYYIDNSSTGCGGSGCADTNAGTSLATAWLTLSKLGATTLSAGQTACLVGQTNPNKTNGGIWRETYTQAGGGTAWGANEVDITAYDRTKLPIITGADCLGAASGLCTGSTAVTWHHCTSNDALCANSLNANITNVYEYTRPTAVQGAIYVDDPDVINTNLPNLIWPQDSSHPSSVFLVWANCLPGGGCAAGTSPSTYEGPMTAGSFYDDGTHLYIWTADASDPGTHIIEATTRQSTTGVVKIYSTANAYTQYSYLKFIYTMDDAIDLEIASTTAVVPTKFDHITCGGTGAGPVANTTQFYSACIMAAPGNGAQPAGAVAASDITITNGTYNWCGRNCLNVQATTGNITETNNIIGTFEHSGLDVKCPYNVTIQGDVVHDAWPYAVIGSPDSTATRNAYYVELDWTACAGGTYTWINDIAYNQNMGFFCNAGGNATSGTVTCKDYNTTVTLGPSYAVEGSCFYTQANSGLTVVRDTENNICVPQNASQYGFQKSTAAGTYTLTEKYNLYYNTTGTNTNYNGAAYTTLAGWQGTGLGASDIWQTDPKLVNYLGGSPLQPGGTIANLDPLPSSPVVGKGNNALGLNTTLMGSQPLPGPQGQGSAW